jgi:hypothetical protein
MLDARRAAPRLTGGFDEEAHGALQDDQKSKWPATLGPERRMQLWLDADEGNISTTSKTSYASCRRK